MGLKQASIKKIFKFYDELDALANKATEMELEAKKGWKEKTAKITRDGKEVELTEEALWSEYRYLGDKSEAGKYLKEKYSKLFDQVELYNKKIDEFKVYTQGELNINPTALTLRDIINLIDAMIELRK
jgi:hypothetical protein